MKRTALALCLFIVLLTPIGLLVQSNLVLADTEASIPKPSVPEFTLTFVDHSYDVPPTYSFDPYTGKNVMTQAGYHVQNKSIEVTIRNQSFLSYLNENGSTVGLFYNIRSKGHFEDWMYEPSSENYIYRSDSVYTVVAYCLGGNNGSDVYSRWLTEISAGGQVDFQVEALIGYYTRIYGTPVPPFMESYNDVFTGESSGWSNTQTITIPDSSTPSPSPAPSIEPTQSPEPQQTEPFSTLPIVAASIMIVAVVAVSVLVYFKKRKR
jgi:hypothetical protein